MSRFLLNPKRFSQAHKQSKSKNALPQDPRYQSIKKILYDSDHPLISKPRVPKETKSPVIGHDVKQDMIERAWFVLKEKEAIQITQDLKRKYVKMRTAMLDLENLDPRLFKKACENPIIQRLQVLTLFPARLRVPTETPPIPKNT